MNWQPIETAPTDYNRKMFAVIAKDVALPNGTLYTTDPYYVWREKDGVGFCSRWPHEFPPTHYHPMPEF